MLKKLFTLYAFVITCFTATPALEALQSSISRGSSLSVEDDSGIFLVSPNNSFTCGFYDIGTNAFVFSIWFSNSANKTVAWTANRDHPVNGRGSRLTFHDDGSLSLTDVDGTVVWITNTSSTQADTAQLLDTGNLVINDPNSIVLWQSFDSPTDTLLPGQPITRKVKLASAMTKGSVSSGYYYLFFDNDNVLKLIYDGPDISSIYWPNPEKRATANGRTRYNSTRYGVLDQEGSFLASDRLSFNASDKGFGIVRRLTLDYDGNLRLYSLHQTTGRWSISWESLPLRCLVHGLCGKNGICTYTQSRPLCVCPPGYEMSNPADWKEGCKPMFNITCEKGEKVKFVELVQTDFWGYDLGYNLTTSLKGCKNICRRDCLCRGIQYKLGIGDCTIKRVLFNGRTITNDPGIMYVKVPRSMVIPGGTAFEVQELSCNSSKAENATDSSYGGLRGKKKWANFYWFLLGFGGIEFVFIAFGWWFVFRRERTPTSLEEGYRMISSQFRKFTYKELKRATNDFKNVLGTGGSGAVYKGVLDDDRAVAVKKLEDATQGEDEFWAEVSVIGKIYHMNLVRMWGFCSESSRRLLVYEYVENGSLDKHLFGDRSTARLLSWKERFKIALGVAKALAYLHHECLEWVIHCDVKPENILLDGCFEPKVADFGLVKLLKRGGDDLNVTHIQGTRGYMAPEWASNLPISAAVDVYSYGVVLLEMVKGSRIGEGEDQILLLTQVRMLRERIESGNWLWFDDFVDGRLNRQFNRRQVVTLVEIAMSCLEEERSKRPSMDDVVEMLMHISEDDGGRI